MSVKIRGGISVVVLSIFFVTVANFQLLTHLNTSYLGDSNDGFKNYYTLLYHIKHDTAYSHFGGMNYPYGEQVVFTDNQPLLSNTVKFISANFIDLSPYTVGIVNGFMLLSMVLTCLLMYALFRRFDVRHPWAAVFALGTGFLAPQIHRMVGHYALAYGFIIPLLILLWIRFRDHPTLKNSILTGTLVLLSSLLHIYYFALSSFFLLGYWLLSNLARREVLYLRSSMKHLMVQVFAPFLILQIWFFLTDHVGDRPANPFGFLAYRAHWQGVFLPITYPLGNFIHSIKPIPQLEWEGIAYVGILPGLMCIRYIAVASWEFLRSRGKKLIGISGDRTLNYLFFTSLGILFFSFGYPFKFHLEGLLGYMGPLKQFRSIGRFAWVFYYGVNLVAFILLYRIIHRNVTGNIGRNALLLLSSAILWYEAACYQKFGDFYQLNGTEELESGQGSSAHKSAVLQVDPARYQAILPLPYYHSGSENIALGSKGRTGKNTMVASVVSGLPLCASNMSRTSFSQTMNNLQLVLEPYQLCRVLDDYPSTKPLLLWIERGEKLSQDEQALATLADIVYQDERVTLASLPIQRFSDGLGSLHHAAWREASDTALYSIGGFLARDSALNFYSEYEPELDSEIEYWVSRPASGNVRDKNVIYSASLPAQDTVPYTLSLWVKFGEDPLPTVRLFFDEFNATNEIVFSESWSFGELVKLLAGDWALIEYHFRPRSKNGRLRFILTKDTGLDMPIYWNGLLLRPTANNIYAKCGSDWVFKNGRTYGRELISR